VLSFLRHEAVRRFSVCSRHILAVRMDSLMGDVTRILEAIELGDASAAEGLFPLVYDELRRLAAQKLAHAPASEAVARVGPTHVRHADALSGESHRRI
jgi:hypothetical protein